MKNRAALIIAVVVALIAGGGVAFAAIPAGDGTIHGCYRNGGLTEGNLKVIDSAATCGTGFTALNWNQAGPTGPQGPAGEQGVQGEPGPVGVSGRQVVQQLFQFPMHPASGERRYSNSVHCPSGKVPTGGGAWGSGDAHFLLNYRLNLSYPTPDGWDAGVSWPSDVGNDPGGLMIYVICVTAN